MLSQIAPPSPNLGLGEAWVKEKIMKKIKFMIIGSIIDKIADI
jgi:hypothetical protein